MLLNSVSLTATGARSTGAAATKGIAGRMTGAAEKKGSERVWGMRRARVHVKWRESYRRRGRGRLRRERVRTPEILALVSCILSVKSKK